MHVNNREMWDLFNVNDSLALSEYEVEKGIVEFLQNEDLDCERAISEAFVFTKKVTKGAHDKIEYGEFMTFLSTLRQIFDYYEVIRYATTKSERNSNDQHS